MNTSKWSALYLALALTLAGVSSKSFANPDCKDVGADTIPCDLTVRDAAGSRTLYTANQLKFSSNLSREDFDFRTTLNDGMPKDSSLRGNTGNSAFFMPCWMEDGKSPNSSASGKGGCIAGTAHSQACYHAATLMHAVPGICVTQSNKTMADFCVNDTTSSCKALWDTCYAAWGTSTQDLYDCATNNWNDLQSYWDTANTSGTASCTATASGSNWGCGCDPYSGCPSY